MMEKYDDIMEREIEKRMASDLWDRGVARSVIRRRRNRFVGVSGAALSAAAAAALLFFAILPGLRQSPTEGEALYRFVTAQVDGTWNSVFDGTVPSGPTAAVYEENFDNGLDDLIGEALASRL